MTQLFTIFVIALSIFTQAADGSSAVSGSLQIGSDEIILTHVRAHLFDNAEGTSSRKKELRILVTDRQVPANSLYGTAFTPIWQMAMRGEVKGLLLECDPANSNEVTSVLLMKPTQPGMSLATISYSATGGSIFSDWKLTRGRVAGSFDRTREPIAGSDDSSRTAFKFKFDVSIDPGPPVTQDLKGSAALASPQVKALSLVADAMARADFAAMKRLSTVQSNAHLAELLASAGARAGGLAKANGTEMKKLLKTSRRVVVRGDRATVIMPGGNSASVARENGIWKSDN